MDLAETYNRIAEDWHRDHSQDDWWMEGTDSFIQQLSLGARILDVGCGSGVKSEYLIAHGFKVTGIDISKNLLAIAKREVPEGKFSLCSMYDLDSMEETFDGVFAQASLLHIPRKDASAVIQKMSGRLTKGGLLYVAVKGVCKGKPLEEVVKEENYGYTYERFFSYFSMDELEEYLTNAGLEITLKVQNPSPSGKTIWLQIIAKK
jgi:SAM-dependent methyltransferase